MLATTAFLPEPMPCVLDQGDTDRGATVVASRRSEMGGREGGMSSALDDSPAAWMMPEMRSTDALARFDANGSSASASSATFW